MTESRRLKLDLITGYALTATRVIAWAIIFAVLIREDLESANVYAYFRGIAAFVLVFMLNLPTALYWRLSIPAAAEPNDMAQASLANARDTTLPYATPSGKSVDELPLQQQILAVTVSSSLFIAGVNLFLVFVIACSGILQPPQFDTEAPQKVLLALAIAAIFRAISDVPGVLLQRTNRLWLDNTLLICCELVTVIAALLTSFVSFIAIVAAISTLLLAVVRGHFAGIRWLRLANAEFPQATAESANLISYGFKTSLAQAADLLYAPLTLLMLGKMSRFTELDLATYSTLLQFDAALLLLTAAITTTLTPRVSNLLSANDPRTALRYTFKATGISLAILTAAAVALYFTAQPILNLWLGQVPAGLLTVLPIFLIHTVIGGASAPLRAVLLLAGKAKALTIANALGGLAVATATFLILKYPTYITQTTGLLPLQAIAAATALSVTLRCALWMPWYTRKTLNHG